MPSVLAYHRPGSLDEASALLAEPNRRVIGGGTVVVPEVRAQHDADIEVVDLQALGLDTIVDTADGLNLGAMVRIGDVADHPSIPTTLQAVGRRELPSALRNQATIGGTVALADPESVLLAALLALGTTVHLHGPTSVPLPELLTRGVGSSLITGISLNAQGRSAWATTARTPMDTPIVAAFAHHNNGETRLALTGVAATPILVDPANPTADLEPPADFRGSSDYRRRLASVLADRALKELNQ